MPYTAPQFIIQICYGIVLLPLYIYVMIQFLSPSKNKHFKAFFFKLSTALGFVDITQYIVVWVFTKITACSLTYRLFIGSEGLYVFNILSYLSYYVVPVRCWLLAAGAANRFTALALPLKHEKIWSKFGKYVLIFSFLFPLPFYISNLSGPTRIYIVNEAIAIETRAEWFPFSRTTISLIQMCVTTTASLLFNVIAFYWYLHRKNSSLNFSNSSYSMETKLLVITFWDFFVDVAYMAVRTIMLVRSFFTGRTNNDDTPYVIAIWIMDLGNLVRPIFLIFMCEALRKSFLKSVGIKKNVSSLVVFSNDK